MKKDKWLQSFFESHPSRDLSLFPLISPDFYQSSTIEVARGLLGKILLSHVGGDLAAGVIVETEAYLSKDDPASHSFRGKTMRNKSMFARGGTAYVYKCYGIHHCFNIVTGQEGEGEAVLIRAIAPLPPFEVMLNRRYGQRMGHLKNTTEKGQADTLYELTNGPGKLTLALGIGLEQDGISMEEDGSCLKVLDPFPHLPSPDISTSTRVGISQGTQRLLRYYVEGSPWVSRVPAEVRKSQRPEKNVSKIQLGNPRIGG